jgi:ABC-type nitrate/sulfonate/bicarbonate transport system permease component/CRP-like cAMP-binding protein
MRRSVEQSKELVTLLKRTMPFQIVSEALLAEIAGLARHDAFEPGRVIYRAGDPADDVYIVVSGRVEHRLEPSAQAQASVKIVAADEVFGWAALLMNQPRRLAETVALERTEVIRLNGNALIALFERDPDSGDVVMSRFATMINRDFTVPESVAVPRRIPRPEIAQQATRVAITMFRLAQWLRSPKPYLMLLGYALFLGTWYLAVEVWKLPRFSEMPGLTDVVSEWFSRNPVYGLSIYVQEYYEHIWVSVWRVSIAFAIATATAVPLGLFLGWSERFKEYVFPVFELLRPIPPLAWVPLAIIMFKGSETPVIFLTFLASFYATALNTMLGVESIDKSFVRAAYCLGARRWQVFQHVIVPGALPFIFTGLQISVGVAWFSLVAAEMVSGQYGLGYVINTSYTMVRYPTIVVGMVTLGIVGYVTSAGVRIVGDFLMQWRVRELALGAQS